MPLIATRNTVCVCGHEWVQHLYGWEECERERDCRDCACPRPRRVLWARLRAWFGGAR